MELKLWLRALAPVRPRTGFGWAGLQNIWLLSWAPPPSSGPSPSSWSRPPVVLAVAEVDNPWGPQGSKVTLSRDTELKWSFSCLPGGAVPLLQVGGALRKALKPMGMRLLPALSGVLGVGPPGIGGRAGSWLAGPLLAVKAEAEQRRALYGGGTFFGVLVGVWAVSGGGEGGGGAA